VREGRLNIFLLFKDVPILGTPAGEGTNAETNEEIDTLMDVPLPPIVSHPAMPLTKIVGKKS